MASSCIPVLILGVGVAFAPDTLKVIIVSFLSSIIGISTVQTGWWRCTSLTSVIGCDKLKSVLASIFREVLVDEWLLLRHKLNDHATGFLDLSSQTLFV
jgi:hypothetical protein